MNCTFRLLLIFHLFILNIFLVKITNKINLINKFINFYTKIVNFVVSTILKV